MLDEIADMIAQVGVTVVFRKYAASDSYNTATGKTTRTYVDYSVPAGVRNYQARDVRGSSLLKEGDREVKIAARALGAVVPEQEDEIQINGKWWRVVKLDTRWIEDNLALHTLGVRAV